MSGSFWFFRRDGDEVVIVARAEGEGAGDGTVTTGDLEARVGPKDDISSFTDMTFQELLDKEAGVLKTNSSGLAVLVS